jgi:hypothetical protein
MPPTLTVIRWRDIPAQVTAKDGRRTAKTVLHRRFQVAIDKAAMKAGKRTASDYIGEWVSDRRRCGEDLDAEVAAVAERLETEHTREVLARLIEQGGWADPGAHPDGPSSDAPSRNDPSSADPSPGESPGPASDRDAVPPTPEETP